MNNKKYTNQLYSTEARDKIWAGARKLVSAVSATLGPLGRNVIITQEHGNPISTKDGVTVAKSINLKDPFENTGAQIIKQSSIKTGEEAGDGTTTSTVLAGSILQGCFSLINDSLTENESVNVVDIRRGIEAGSKEVSEFLNNLRSNISQEEQLMQVATISGNNDPEVGRLVSTAMDKAGVEGVVTVEESRTGESYLETVEGVQFNRGYTSPYFVTDNKSMKASLKNPYILITDERISQVKDLLPILEAVSSENKPLLIVADDISGEALATLVLNKAKGVLQVAAVKAPDFGDRKKQALSDIATITGAEVVTKEAGRSLARFNTQWLGKAKTVHITKDDTTIVDGNGSTDQIAETAESIKAQIEEAKSPYEIENLQKRLARLIGGVAVMYVGGMTEVEMKERKDRVEDALFATRAALEEGIVPGGGKALLLASLHLREWLTNSVETLSPDMVRGVEVLIDSLQAPARTILRNRFYNEDDVERVISELIEKEDWVGYNPVVNEFVNTLEQGIIDPTKVVRLALQNAVSSSATLLTTEVIVALEEEEANEDLMMG